MNRVSHKKPSPEEALMYTLYYSPGSASMAPHGRVPTPAVDGKPPIHEATAICLFIVDRHPRVAMRPAIMPVLQQNRAA
jgi:glutathione S-transferase